ncbi:MAG: DNA adenine methylase [Chloroflexota bacterium]|nr:DNA adenine methylase [Chloroflexota bacterium]MDE2840627.1 DNA adenine methylase [Chloroflexota bacterium]MDE2931627.1 DNA adenine methylase [Chloroflexota bacterium]
MRFDSPLRYPGGKATLAPLLASIIEANCLSGCSYYEPFAGGAGAALRLLREGVVSKLFLNDLDPHIISFWYAVLNEPDRFAKEIMSIPLSIDEWKKQLEIYQIADAGEPFQLGFATFYLNRCNRSGIISGAAPIGGYQQAGEWKIDARFYRERLSERILAIGSRREQIHVTNMDALEFLKEILSSTQDESTAFAYLDPPYYSNGNRLYMTYYNDRDHVELAHYIQRQRSFKWIMSYDDTEFIRDLYTASEISVIPLEYSLQGRREVQELLVSPSHVLLASPTTSFDAEERESEEAPARK